MRAADERQATGCRLVGKRVRAAAAPARDCRDRLDRDGRPDAGHGHAGPGTDLGGLGWFVGVWAVMMAAMMLPSLAPMAGAYAPAPAPGEAGPRARRSSRSGTSCLGLAGSARLCVSSKEFDRLDLGLLAWDSAGRYVAGGVIAGGALYEFTPMKAGLPAPLPRPRAARRRLAEGAGGPSAWVSTRAPLRRLSWALMAALFALGVMSITWMVVIAALIVLEKVLPWRERAEAVTVVVLLCGGGSRLLLPGPVPGLAVPGSPGGDARDGLHGDAPAPMQQGPTTT